MSFLTSFSLSPVLANISSKVTLSAQAAQIIHSLEPFLGSGFLVKVTGILDFLFSGLI